MLRSWIINFYFLGLFKPLIMKVVHFSVTFKINKPAAWHNELNARQYCGNPNLATVMLFKNYRMKPQHMDVVAKM